MMRNRIYLSAIFMNIKFCVEKVLEKDNMTRFFESKNTQTSCVSQRKALSNICRDYYCCGVNKISRENVVHLLCLFIKCFYAQK